MMNNTLFRLTAAAVLLASLAACSFFSTTPDAHTRDTVRSTLSYGMPADKAAEKLSGLDFACSKRTGNYVDESGSTHKADHFLACVKRPNAVSFTCENRDEVTVVLREDVVSGIEVTRGPSCERN